MTRPYLHAEFRTDQEALAAAEALARAGIADNAVALYSHRPVEGEAGHSGRPSRMSLVAVLAAIASGSAATMLMYAMQTDYPLVTGGMPIASGWATGVVTFEATMAGAVLGIVLTLVWEAGLLRRRRAPVPKLPEEGVIVQVRCSADPDALRSVLSDAGAVSVEAVEA